MKQNYCVTKKIMKMTILLDYEISKWESFMNLTNFIVSVELISKLIGKK